MIVPHYWSEARAQRPRARHQRQFTVRRMGWSETSQGEADAMARKRADEALARLVAGADTVLRREPKTPYNGAEGVPIREEVVSRHSDLVVTRNSYGAECLNIPDVVFADIDFSITPSFRRVLAHGTALLFLAAFFVAWSRSGLLAFFLALAVLALSYPFASWTQVLYRGLKGGALKAAVARVHDFSSGHPDWHLRLYRTPAGLRVLVLHRLFSARSPEVDELFTRLGVDPLYAKMCRNQQCFRARLTPKPWRIGMEKHLGPRPGLWPIKPEHMPRRQAWVREYERRSADYAACEFLEALGSGVTHAKAAVVVETHDRLSHAMSGRSLA